MYHDRRLPSFRGRSIYIATVVSSGASSSLIIRLCRRQRLAHAPPSRETSTPQNRNSSRLVYCMRNEKSAKNDANVVRSSKIFRFTETWTTLRQCWGQIQYLFGASLVTRRRQTWMPRGKVANFCRHLSNITCKIRIKSCRYGGKCCS